MSARLGQHDERVAAAEGAPASAMNGPSLGDEDFAFLRRFVYDQCGIALSEQKRQLVQGRLQRRLRALQLRDFSEYCEVLKREPDAELGELASAISTNVTAFFREMHHYDLLVEKLLPEWLEQKRRQGDRLRIWSAGCSTGEEPYALAMVLDAARKGVYALDRLGGVSDERRKRWFLRGQGEYDGLASVHPRLRELVTILPLNLLHDWPMQGPFDAIFCRNVVIYFDKPTKEKLFARYAQMLPAGGYLFLGHSESMHGLSNDFELIGRTVYRKRP
jgi:chemotaxis protein methyltransferase CheR